MKLYEAPRNVKVRTIDGGNEYMFKHIDGMYSLCYTDKGEVVHLAAWTEVEVLDDET